MLAGWDHPNPKLSAPMPLALLLAATCACGRRIRVAKATLAEASILCGLCQQPFEPADSDQDSD
jgi:hypothetical protein